MNENELIVKEKAQETTAVAPVSEKTITNYLETFGMLKNMPKNLQGQCVEVAKAFQLNPFKREVHFVQHRDKNGDPTVAIVVGYEVYIKRAQRTGLLDGWDCTAEGSGPNMVAILTIYRKDWSRPFKHSVKRSEYDRGIGNWKVMPETMLKKVAISQGFRLCFPEELGGMPYTKEEQWEPEVIQETMRDVTPESSRSENLNSSNAPEAMPGPAPDDPQATAASHKKEVRIKGVAADLMDKINELLPQIREYQESIGEKKLEELRSGLKAITDQASANDWYSQAFWAIRRAKENGTAKQKYPWASPEQRAELEKMEHEYDAPNTVGEPAPPLGFGQDDSKELYEK